MEGDGVHAVWLQGPKLGFNLFRFCMFNKKSQVHSCVMPHPMENLPHV